MNFPTRRRHWKKGAKNKLYLLVILDPYVPNKEDGSVFRGLIHAIRVQGYDRKFKQEYLDFAFGLGWGKLNKMRTYAALCVCAEGEKIGRKKGSFLCVQCPEHPSTTRKLFHFDPSPFLSTDHTARPSNPYKWVGLKVTTVESRGGTFSNFCTTHVNSHQ